jgi:hypothetical protein
MNFLSETRFKISSRCEHEPFHIAKGKKRLGKQNVEIIEGPLARKNLGVVGKGKRNLENKMSKY